ncbi:MAG: hypothetical protein AAGE52_30370 [Myxococcota bacterium]
MSKLADFVESRGHGVISKIARESGVSWTTVSHAAKGGRLERYSVAKKIRDAVLAMGGDISIADLCDSTESREHAADQ